MRPVPDFYGFIGQQDIVNSCQRLVDGAMATGRPFCHTLLCGKSGIGKSELASSIGKSMSVTTKYVLSGPEVGRVELCEALHSLEPNDILFVDEIQRLPKATVECLFPAIDQRRTFKTVEKKGAKVISDEWRPIHEFTLIAATDRPGSLLNAIRRRLPQTYTLSSYNQRDLREIVAVRAAQIQLALSPQAISVIARVSRGTPRAIKHILEKLTLYFPYHEQSTLGTKEVRNFLKSEKIDHKNGLNSADRQYLSYLQSQGNKAVSLGNIALLLGHDTDWVSTELEPYLIETGMINITRQGRILTEKGHEYIGASK